MPDLLLDPPLPDGVTARGATMDDVAAAVAVTRAAERLEGRESLTALDDIAGDWARPSMDITADVLLVEESGHVIAYAEEFHGRAFAHVHPDATGRGIGSALAAWTEHHARAAGRAQVGQTLSTGARTARQLLEGRGYEARWESWILTMALDATLAPPRVPAGVIVRGPRHPDDDRDLHAVIEEAFDTWPDRDDGMAFEDWRASYLDRAREPGLMVVAEEAGHIVGAAVCIPEGHVGWVDQLAVRPTAWGRGIAGAMLQTAFRGFRDAGLTSAALSTDSRTGALGLYEHVGMSVTESFSRYSLSLAR